MSVTLQVCHFRVVPFLQEHAQAGTTPPGDVPVLQGRVLESLHQCLLGAVSTDPAKLLDYSLQVGAEFTKMIHHSLLTEFTLERVLR